MNFEQLLSTLKTVGLSLGLKALSAIAIWVIGRWLISAISSLLRVAERLS